MIAMQTMAPTNWMCGLPIATRRFVGVAALWKSLRNSDRCLVALGPGPQNEKPAALKEEWPVVSVFSVG